MDNREPFVFNSTRDEISIGRDESCDIVLRGIGVSRKHAVIKSVEGVFVITDNGSACGTRHNGDIIKEQRLSDGDKLTFGVAVLSVSICNNQIKLKQVTHLNHNQKNEIPDKDPSDLLSVGRGEMNTVRLNHPLISRTHFRLINQKNGKYLLKDNNSTNGTYINGKRAATALIDENDIIQAGPFRFLIDKDKLVQVEDHKKIKIEVNNACVVKGGRHVIEKMDLTVNPGEFTAIMGPSGSGKTTLLEAVSGRIALQKGGVYYNGLLLERFLPAFNSMVGYVGQSNLLRGSLRVRETFEEQALLRLPGDSLQVERENRIDEVLNTLNISRLSGSRIDRLSGGEAKRVHFGVELISSPTVIFFDEPFSGLDPGLIKKFMGLFRSICDRGHSLVLATHRLEQVELCDRIVFVNKGKVLASGKPEDLPKRFDAGSLPEVYEKAYNMDREEVSKYHEAGRKHCPENIKRAVPADEAHDELECSEKQGFLEKINRKRIFNGPFRRKSVGILRQFILLAARYLKIACRDTRTMLVVFSQVPAISLMLILVYERGGDYLPLSFYFCITITSVWIGGINSIRDISGEWMLFVKESSIGLSSSAYLFSKIVVLLFSGLIQSAAFSGLIFVLFQGVDVSLQFTALVFAGVISGMLLGLFISSFSSSVGQSVSWLPVLFIPQIVFSGILVPFDYMPGWGETISRLTVTRPIFSMFKKVYFLDQYFAGLPEWRSLFFINLVLVILIYAGLKYYLLKHWNSA